MLADEGGIDCDAVNVPLGDVTVAGLVEVPTALILVWVKGSYLRCHRLRQDEDETIFRDQCFHDIATVTPLLEA